MKKLVLSMVVVFAFATITSLKANTNTAGLNKYVINDSCIENFMPVNLGVNYIYDYSINEFVALCATIAFHAANAAEAASGRTFSFEEWKFYFDLNNAACLNMR